MILPMRDDAIRSVSFAEKLQQRCLDRLSLEDEACNAFLLEKIGMLFSSMRIHTA